MAQTRVKQRDTYIVIKLMNEVRRGTSPLLVQKVNIYKPFTP